jgi:hypothetical protein
MASFVRATKWKNEVRNLGAEEMGSGALRR